MDERAALAMIGEAVPAAGDDAAIVGETVVSTDMLHERTDFPPGTSRYTAGWRAVGASLSDVAAVGAGDPSAVAVYAAPSFEADALRAFIDGARDVCECVDGAYVGGDLDTHDEFTVATTALGSTRVEGAPVRRTGAEPGEAVCVTGTLGRTAAALRLFERGATERANQLFRFPPRVTVGETLAGFASAMLDSSDGLARSLHQLGAASGVGFTVESATLPIDASVRELAADEAEAITMSTTVGEDFELVCTLPPERVSAAREACPIPLAEIGRVTTEGITMDDDPLPNEGYTHGN